MCYGFGRIGRRKPSNREENGTERWGKMLAKLLEKREGGWAEKEGQKYFKAGHR